MLVEMSGFFALAAMKRKSLCAVKACCTALAWVSMTPPSLLLSSSHGRRSVLMMASKASTEAGKLSAAFIGGELVVAAPAAAVDGADAPWAAFASKPTEVDAMSSSRLVAASSLVSAFVSLSPGSGTGPERPRMCFLDFSAMCAILGGTWQSVADSPFNQRLKVVHARLCHVAVVRLLCLRAEKGGARTG